MDVELFQIAQTCNGFTESIWLKPAAVASLEGSYCQKSDIAYEPGPIIQSDVMVPVDHQLPVK